MEPKILRTCELETCDVQFTPKSSHQRFCCSAHKYRALRLRKKQMGNINVEGDTSSPSTGSGDADHNSNVQSPMPLLSEPKERKDLPVPSGISETARFIIDNLKEQRDDWKEEWKEEREARRKLLKDYETLEKELRDLKHEHEMESVRNEKPSALQGLADSPLMPYIGPVIQELGLGVAKAVSSKIAGIGTGAPTGDLKGISADIMSMVASWLPKMSEPTQQAFMQMMMAIIQMDEAQAQYYISNIINLLENGSTAAPTGTGY